GFLKRKAAPRLGRASRTAPTRADTLCAIRASRAAGEPLLAPEPIELLVPPHRLAVFAILDLHPGRPSARETIGRLPELGDDAFEVTLDDLGKEVHAAPMDMGQKLQAPSSARDDSTQDQLPLYER